MRNSQSKIVAALGLAAALALSLAAPAARAQDLVAVNGSDVIRLKDEPCSSKAVVEALAKGGVDARTVEEDFKRAQARVGGQSFEACWADVGSGAFLVYEDGDQGYAPADAFELEGGQSV